MDPLLQWLLAGLGCYGTLTYLPLVVAVPIMAIMPAEYKEAGNWLAEIFARWAERQIGSERINQYMALPIVLPIGLWLVGLGHLVLLLMVTVNLSRKRGAMACLLFQDVLSE